MTPDPDTIKATLRTSDYIHRQRTFSLMTSAALAAAGIGLPPANVARARRAKRSVTYRPPSLHAITRPEKFPGQRRAYLAGASRSMTAAEVREHNAALAAGKECAA